MANILAAVSDEAFATLLKDGLENTREHQVKLVYSEKEVRQALDQQAIDLAIVDVDLEDLQPVDLVRMMRQIRPALRIIWMPFLGCELSEEMLALDTQGILTKPFFMGDLPAQIAEALSKPQPQMAGAPPAAASSKTSTDQPAPGTGPLKSGVAQGVKAPAKVQSAAPDLAQIKDILNRLALDLDAESVLIVDRQGTLLAQAGHRNRKEALQLASMLTNEITATANVATFLKEKGGYFTNNIHEGNEHRLFSVVLTSDGLALSVITRVDIPLGTVRFHIRQAVSLLNSSFRHAG